MSRGLSALEMGAIFSLASIGTIFSRVIFGKLSDLIGRKPLLITGTLIETLAVCFYTFVQKPLHLACAKLLREFGKSVSTASLDAVQSEHFSKDAIKKYVRRVAIALPSGRAVACILGIFFAGSYFTGFVFVAFLLLLCTFLFFFLPEEKSRKKRKEMIHRFKGVWSRNLKGVAVITFIAGFSFYFSYFPGFSFFCAQ